MDYYYQNPNSARVGPLDEATFFAHATAGTILFNALVWRSGEENWAPWANVAAAWMSGAGGVPAGAECGADEDTEDGEVISDDLGIDSLFGEAWEIFKRHWGKFVFFGLICSALSFASEAGRAWLDFARESSGEELAAGIIPAVIVLSLLSGVVSAGLTLGALKIARKEDTGTPAGFGDIFPIGRMVVKFLKFLGAGCVWFTGGFVAYFPLVMLVVSGAGTDDPSGSAVAAVLGAAFFLFIELPLLILFVTRLAFVAFFIFDTDCGVFAAFKASWRATRGKFWRTFGYGVLSALLVMFGSLFTLGLGAILLIPLGAVWYAVYYVKLCKNCDDALPESTLTEDCD